LRWRYRVPFGFDIEHAIKSGDLLVLAGRSDTVALYLGTNDPRGEVAWQEREEGELYGAPYLHGDRLVSVRSMPFNVTTRYRSTGRLIGRLALPDLSLSRKHPFLRQGPEALPMAADAGRIVVTDEQYYLMLDVERMTVLWKRMIDALDQTQSPAFRFELKGDHLAVLKRDYDADAIYMLSSDTGEVRWHTDRKDRESPQPIHSMSIRDGRLYGIRPRPGQRFDFVGLDCATGEALFQVEGQKGYAGDPEAELRSEYHGNTMLAEIRDRQTYELKAFDMRNGKCIHTLKVKGVGRFGEHGRVSATGQNGMMVLMGKHKLVVSGNVK
jgi:outer membrane protein assembly factor BamB